MDLKELEQVAIERFQHLVTGDRNGMPLLNALKDHLAEQMPMFKVTTVFNQREHDGSVGLTVALELDVMKLAERDRALRVLKFNQDKLKELGYEQ